MGPVVRSSVGPRSANCSARSPEPRSTCGADAPWSALVSSANSVPTTPGRFDPRQFDRSTRTKAPAANGWAGARRSAWGIPVADAITPTELPLHGAAGDIAAASGPTPGPSPPTASQHGAVARRPQVHGGPSDQVGALRKIGLK